MLARALAGLVLALAAAGTAVAGEPTLEEKAGARAAAEQGNGAFKAGRFAEALDLFQRAETLLHAPTHVLMIARTQAALGHLVAAKEALLSIARETLAPSAPAPFKKAQVSASAELAAIEPRIPTIHVTARGGGSKHVEITMDGKPVPDALVGIARPVDPGPHKLRATAEGMQSDERQLDVQEKDRLTVVLELRATTAPAPPAATPEMPPAQRPSAPAASSTATEPTPPAPDSGGGPLRPISIGMMGVGVVGLGVGTVFAVLASSKRSEADEAYAKCGNPCPEERGGPAVRQLDDDATAKSTVAVISLIAGGVLTAGGIVLFAVSGSPSRPPAQSARAAPWIALDRTSFASGLSGSF